MKILRYFFILLILFNNLFADGYKINIGVLYEKIFTTKKEAKIGSKLWLKKLEDGPYANKMAIKFYKDEDKLIKDFINKKILIILSNATFYYENKNNLDKYIYHKWIMSRSKGMFDKFYLIKNKKSKSSLQNKIIYYKEDTAREWLNLLLYKKNKKMNSNILKKIEKPNKLIYNIFFNKNDLSIISKDLYDAMLDLNPQIKNNIEIIEESKPIFFNGIGFTRKDIDHYFQEMLDYMAKEVIKEDHSLDIISFIDIQKIYTLKEGDLTEVDKFYKEYLLIKKLFK